MRYGQFGVSYSFNGCEGGDITAATSDPAECERKHFSFLFRDFNFFCDLYYVEKSHIEFDHLKWSTTVSCMNSF